MNMIQGTLLLSLSSLMFGCAPPPAEVDGVACAVEPQARNKQVYIDVRYGADGMPAVAQETCAVVPGTVIVWRTEEGEARPFEIVFKGAAPGRAVGRAEERRYRARLTAGRVAAETRFQYGIRANGRELDPVIIIRNP